MNTTKYRVTITLKNGDKTFREFRIKRTGNLQERLGAIWASACIGQEAGNHPVEMNHVEVSA